MLDTYQRLPNWLVQAAMLIVGLESYRVGDIKGSPGSGIRGATKGIGIALVLACFAIGAFVRSWPSIPRRFCLSHGARRAATTEPAAPTNLIRG